MRRFSCILVVIILLFVASPLQAEPDVRIHYEYYDIRGESVEELISQILELGVKWEDGNTYAASTKWHVTWSYQYESGDGKCRIAAVSTEVDVTHKMPRWPDYSSVPEDLKHKWDAYVQALERHEAEHRAMGIDAADKLQRVVTAMDSYEACGELHEKADALGQQVLKEFVEKDRQYDLETEYGATEGATLRKIGRQEMINGKQPNQAVP